MEKEEENQIKETSLEDPTASMNSEMDSKLEENLKSELEISEEENSGEREEKRGENSLAIHLGDILRILSPTNLKYHDKIFLVDYCGKENLKWVDVESGFRYELKLIGKNHEEFEEKEGIFSIELLSREKYPGYAKQNGLEAGVWVDVEFGGDLPFLVTGLITNLEEDQIEITLWPNQEVFYLDFRYEGLDRIEPKIEKIQIRDAPSLEAEKAMEELREQVRKSVDELEDLVDGEQEEMDELNPSLEKEEAEINQLEKLREEYVQGTAFAKSILPEIEYGEVLGNYFQRVEQRKEDIRYSLNAQVEDFMNELLSTIPNFMRTPKVMEEMEQTLRRFRELHEMFARNNGSGVVVGYRSNRYRGKPLVSSILEGGETGGKWMRNMGWILPVVYLRKKGWHDMIVEDGDDNFDASNNDEDGYFNVQENQRLYDDGSSGNEWVENPACVWLKGIQEAMDKWISQSGSKTGGNGGYRRLLQDLDKAMRPCEAFTKAQLMDLTVVGNRREGNESLADKMVGPYEAGVPLETVVDNTSVRKEGVFGNTENDGFYSTVSKGGSGEKLVREDVVLTRRRFVVQKQVDSVSLLAMRWSNSGKKKLERETVVGNEKMALKSVLFLPEAWMEFSRVGLAGTDILTRVRLGSWWPQISRVLNKYTSVDNVAVDDLTRDYPYNSVGEARCGVSHQAKGMRRGGSGMEGQEEEDKTQPCDSDNPSCNIPKVGGAGGEVGAMGEFLSGVREYVLAKENVKTGGTVSQPLETLLNTVIPNNLYLIDFMCPYLAGSEYSLMHYAQILEPFGVYLWNMRYAESYVMQKKIRDKTSEYRVHMEKERKEYGAMEQYFNKNAWGMKYRTTERFFHWFRSRGEDFLTSFLGWYHLNVGALTTSEILSRIYNLDEGNLLSVMMTYFHYALITLNRFTKGIRGGSGESLWNWDEGERGRLGISGGKRKLVKRYASLSELQEDNHRTDLFWDKGLDISPYHLAEQYGGETGGTVGNGEEGGATGIALKINNVRKSLGENQSMAMEDKLESGGGIIRQTMRQKLAPSEFLEYLAMNLKERHLCPAEQAVELASILISGRRPIKEGEYASVQLGGGDVGYYKRRHHVWERDNTLDFGKEGADEKSVFSNLEKVGGGLGVRYTDGGSSGKKGEILEEREVVTLSGDIEEARRIAKWEDKKLREKKGGAGGEGGAGEDEESKKEKELAKEMFQQKIQQSLKELEALFEKEIQKQMEKTIRIYSLKQSEAKRANSFAYYLGKYKKEIDTRISPHAALMELILEEPDFGLKQQYIVRFYHAFCREPILNGAVGAVGVEEKIYWKYCAETNVPLLPTSYYDLAVEFMAGGDYGGLLDVLCSTIGDKSSDGEAVIDKYTGRVLKKLDLDIEEGYDEMGFQRKTREILGSEDSSETVGGDLGESSAAEGNRVREEERRLPIEKEEDEIDENEEESGEYLTRIDEALASGSAGVVLTKSFSKTAQDYGDGENEMIARIGLYFLQEMGLFSSEELVEDIIGFVIPLVSDLLSNKDFIETEKRFEQKRKLALEKGKSFPFASYDVYKNQKLLYATLGATLIGIQTINSGDIKLTRNYSSCIRSLRGYPTGLGGSGKEDKSALRYIVCLLLQQQSDEAPWNARVKGKKEETQMNVVTEYVDNYLIKNKVVEDRIGAKRAYEIEHGTGLEETVPTGLRLEKQVNLLPPTERGLHVEDRQIMSVSREFLEEWKGEIRRALKTTATGSEGVVRARLMALGYSLFENVNGEVARQVRDFLMKTVLGEAYLENACCQGRGAEEGPYPLGYFVSKNPLVGKVMKISRILERSLERAESPKKSVLLYHSESTRMGNGEFWDRGNGSSYFKANIYAALIHYFHYDRPLLPVPEYLRGTVYEEPPKDYPVGASLKEKIDFLERSGRNYDVEKLQYCLKLVGQHNILTGGMGEGMVHAEEDGEHTKIGEALGDFLTSSVFELSPSGASGVYGDLLQKMTDVFREWKRGSMQNSASPKIRALNTFLAKSNAAMFERISKEWKPMDDKERGLLSFLERVQVWKLAGDIDRESVNRANSDSLQQIVRFIRDMCSMFSFVYSQRIGVMQEFNAKKRGALPKHWGFADDHYQLLTDYIRKTFGQLIRKRDATDDVLFMFFERVATGEDSFFRQLRQLLEFFPVFTPLSLVVGENGEKEVFYSLFPKETCYGVHVFCLYMILSRILEVSQSYEVLNLGVQTSKKERLREREKRGEMDNERDLVVSMEDALEGSGFLGKEGAMDDYSIALQEDAEDRQVWEGKRSVLKEKIRHFIYDCLEVERDNKQVVDMTYEDLRQKQDETEKREKKRITDRLKNMEIYERRVENQMKDLKLGNWNVGLQKGLFQYDKETFKREMLEQQYGLSSGGLEENMEGRGAVLYDTERGDLGEDFLNGEEADRLRDMELNGEIMGLGEDWDDGGDYY